jgi:serine phosphatase RsbU (regulator of sigma subunit)/pSer/pThr/pTyr-binding forkhead associated (FHA) protein
MAVLQVLKGSNPGQQFPLEEDRTILGRHPDCNIVLEVGAVSRQHAQILFKQGVYYVEDLDSRNGTQLNGQEVKGRGPQPLANNDRVKICDLLFTFHNEEAARSPASETVDDSNVTFDDEHGSIGQADQVRIDDETPAAASTIMGTLDLRDSRQFGVSVKAEAKLKALIEITETLSASLSIDQVLPKILEALFKVFVQADRGFIMLAEGEDAQLVPKSFRHRRESAESNARISRTIINKVMSDRSAILSADAVSDRRFDMSQSVADFRIRSMMCVPMFSSDGKPLGLIQLDSQDQLQRFEQDDLTVLAGVAHQAAFAVENAQLHETLIHQQAVQQELEFGRQVQQGFLPLDRPHLPGYEFEHYYQPAKQVGGDYYDYIQLPGGRWGVVLGDVSGKGVGAALLMAKLSSEVRYSLLSETSPGRAMERLNDSFSDPRWDDRFVTMVLFTLDPTTHEVKLVNAGHMAPILRRADGTVEELDAETTLPIGVVEGTEYTEHTFTLGPNESLTVFTDGFSEAMNDRRELYGVERLRDRVACPCSGVVDLALSIVEDVRLHIGRQAQNDDQCLVCFGRTDD